MGAQPWKRDQLGSEFGFVEKLFGSSFFTSKAYNQLVVNSN